jgi:CDP-diacylglycerol---glycerol-3-phosphate 3-phosphatidyltransferase
VTGSLVSAATRQRVRDLATPIATTLGRLGLTPNELTVAGFLGMVAAAWFAADRSWFAAGVLILLFGVFDLFDGALARATGQATKLGAFLDSTFDRAGEGIVFLGIVAGLAWSNLTGGAIIAAAAMLASFLVSYTRAKSESLGFTPGTGMAAIGLMPREVRIVVLALGLMLGGLLGADALPDGEVPGGISALLIALGVIAFGASITTIQRILHVRAQAKEG